MLSLRLKRWNISSSQSLEHGYESKWTALGLRKTAVVRTSICVCCGYMDLKSPSEAAAGVVKSKIFAWFIGAGQEATWRKGKRVPEED